MKRIALTVILVVAISSLFGAQMFQKSEELTEVEKPTLTVKDNPDNIAVIGSSYPEKGIFFLVIAGILLIIWFLLRYKV